MKEREAYGVKFVVSEETFNEYKGTLQDQLEEAYKKIDRLNNIINELEKDLKSKIEWNENILKEDNGKPDLLGFNFHREAYIKIWEEVLDKLKELKEGNKDE